MSTSFRTLTARQIEALQPRIVEIYQAAFCAPPYNKPQTEIDEFSEGLLRQLDRDDYRFLGAFDEKTDHLVGFTYGYAVKAGVWWLAAVRPAMHPEIAAHWLEHSFQFVEIAVDPPYQGRGIGACLHDGLLAGVHHTRAVLSTLQADTAASRLYRNRGWVVLLENLTFPGVDRIYKIMGVELGGR